MELVKETVNCCKEQFFIVIFTCADFLEESKTVKIAPG